MRRALRLLVLCVAALLATAVGVYRWRNPETATLDSIARVGAAGQFVTLSSGVTHYEVAGPDTGRVVLLVHGFSVPYYIWDSTFTALRDAGYRVIRYDVYGRGLSDRPDAAYDGPFFDTQINELLDSLRIRAPIDIVGLSFGGFITSHYVAGHAGRVRTLTMIDPMSQGASMPAIMASPVVGPWLWQVAQVPGMAEGQASDFLHPEQFPGWADRYRPQMRFSGFGRALLRSALQSSHVRFDTLFANVAKTATPTLLVWGKQDQTVKFELSSVSRTSIPGLEFFPVDSAGHLPHMERAALVNARLFAFLALHSP